MFLSETFDRFIWNMIVGEIIFWLSTFQAGTKRQKTVGRKKVEFSQNKTRNNKPDQTWRSRDKMLVRHVVARFYFGWELYAVAKDNSIAF